VMNSELCAFQYIQDHGSGQHGTDIAGPTAVLGGMTMQRETRILTFADVDPVPNQVDVIPEPAQALPYSYPAEFPPTKTYIVDVARMWSLNKALPILDAMFPCIKEVVDVSFAQHNRTNGSTVSLIDGNMVGKKLFSVSIYPSHSMTLWERPSWEELFEYAKANLDLLLQPGHAMGTWFNDYELMHVLDVVVCLSDRNEALDLAKRYLQLAIYDLQSRREIRVPRQSEKLLAGLAGGANA
jgi:hypothetical protein